jgi:hypothetical protein
MNRDMGRGGKQIVYFSLIFLLIINVVFAAENVTDITSSTSSNSVPDFAKSYNWLHAKTSNVTTTTEITSLTMIALAGSGKPLTGYADDLTATEDATNKCWPKGGCKVKETSLATLALALSGKDITKEVEWLKKAKAPMTGTGGEWILVIKGENGACDITYPPSGTKKFNLEDEKIKTQTGGFTTGQYYINLNELNPLIVRSNVQPEIGIKCESTLSNPIVSLIYRPNSNTFFVQKSEPGFELSFKVSNVCFGTSVPATSCNYDSTLYATWALSQISTITNDQTINLEGLGTHIYLQSQSLTRREAISLGLLNYILIRSGNAAPSFLSELVKLQRSDGSWNGDVAMTSISLFGLYGSDKSEAVAKAATYLTRRVDREGSWNKDAYSTAWALIALKGAELSRIHCKYS